MSRFGWEALQDVRECLEVPLRCSGVNGRPSRMSGSGREAFPDIWEDLSNIWEWSEGPPVYPGVVGNPQGWSVGLPNVWACSEGPLK